MATAPLTVPPQVSYPAAPQGWEVSWSDQHNRWFYVNQTTGASQWESPSDPAYSRQPVTDPQPGYYNLSQPQYAQQEAALQPGARATTGFMGKLGNLDPKAQTALAVGSGLVAGAFLEHEYDEYQERPHHSHHLFGTMTSLMGAAGAGALGAKFFGRKAQASQAAAPPPQTQGMMPGAPIYGQFMRPNSTNQGGGTGGLGNMAVGGAAGVAGALALGEASNLLHHHHSLEQVPATAGGKSSMGSFLGGLTPYSGPRLYIHAAAYADMDVTEKCRALVTHDQVLSFESITDEFMDPWPEVPRKMFSVLYQYGDRPMEVWAGSTSDKRVDIRHEALANKRMAYVNKDPGRIISLIWQDSNVLSPERIEKLEKDGELDCSGFDVDGFRWGKRNLICYYRASQGGVGIGHGRESGTMRLPWNPLSKWS